MSDTSSFQLINVGAVPNDGTGDDIRDAFIKINSNFSNIVAIGENVGNLKVAGFANIAGNINLSGYLNVVGNVNYSSSNVTTFQTFSVIGTTDSTTPTNGALVVAGGAGVVKNLHVGGTVTAAGFYGTISTTNQPSINQLGTLVSLNVGGSTTFHNVVYANTAMNSSNVYTGAMVIAGGIGLTGNLNLTGGIGAGGTLGQNGQFLVSSGMGIAWSNAPIASTLIYGATSVTTTANFTNVVVNGTNIATFSNTSLTISGNISANYFTGNGALLTGISTYGNANVSVFLSTYSGMMGNLSTLNVIGNITAGNIIAGGVRQTTAVNPPVNPTVGDQWYDSSTDILFQYTYDGTNHVWVDISSLGLNTSSISLNITSNGTFGGNLTINGNNSTTAINNGGTSGYGNIGASGATFNTIFAKATTAQYADLAEKYLSDQNYESGTVLVFGGKFEVTASTKSHDPTVAGVVTTNPAYLMNDSIDGVAVALTGRVPCYVLGPINKGDCVVTSPFSGVAQKLNNLEHQHGCIIGKSLESMTIDSIKLIEIAIGRV